jgi:hypothetical protein
MKMGNVQIHVATMGKTVHSNNTMEINCLKCGTKRYYPICRIKAGNGKFCSKSCSNSFNNSGFNNPATTGNPSMEYNNLHSWIKRRLKKPDTCQNCKSKKSLDLANKSGNYLKELSDWWYICRKCHMDSDGRMEIFINSKRNRKTL